MALTLLKIVKVFAHGFLSYLPPRGIEKKEYEIDTIKNPNFGGQICRGGPPGTVTDVDHSVTLQLDIYAAHTGLCAVYILDEDLNNSQNIADKDDCAAPSKAEAWTVAIPDNITGRKGLRWTWNVKHMVTTTKPSRTVPISILAKL
jgi:hypothetical protein